MTRAMTLTMQEQGGRAVLSIGRVQTPTLAIVVQRELQIRNFKPKDYFVCTAQFDKGGNRFTAKFLPENNENLGGDEEGYLIDRSIAEAAVSDIKKSATVVKFTSKKASSNQPLCYALSTLQKDASSKLGFGAKKTLDVAQKLYEKGITSYPRSDCGYLPEEQLSSAPEVLKTISSVLDIAKKADSNIQSSTWNTKKVGAHHGIIPTEKAPSSLDDDEFALYMLIAKRYVAQFFPPESYLSLNAIIEDAGKHIWTASGKNVINPGWKVVYQGVKDEDEEEKPAIPDLQDGEKLDCIEAGMNISQTKPPSRFTEGSLISAMSSVQNFVENPNYKKILKETSGIGTEATRADVIEKLLQRHFLQKQKSNLVPTELAISMIQSLPPKLKDPGVTAVWEEYLKLIETGKMTYEQFIGEQKKFIPIFINDVKEIRFPQSVIESLPKPKASGSSSANKKTYTKKKAS
jgi:DNA topoisomerase-3